MVRWYWSADTLFWQLSIDVNIDVQSAFSWAPKVARKCESKHWYACGADGRAVGGRCTVTWLANFLGWVDLLTHGALRARAPLKIAQNEFGLLLTEPQRSLISSGTAQNGRACEIFKTWLKCILYVKCFASLQLIHPVHVKFTGGLLQQACVDQAVFYWRHHWIMLKDETKQK